MLLVSADNYQLDKASKTEIAFDESIILNTEGSAKEPLSVYLMGEKGRDFDPENSFNVYLQQKLTMLFNKWQEETAFYSSPDDMINNHNYKEIVKFGESMIQPILNELETEPSTLVWALNSITGLRISSKPVNIKEACELWVEWGRYHKFI